MKTPPPGFFGFTVTRPVAVFMITTAFAVFGAVSYRRLSLNLMPDISYPSVTIRTVMDGAAPEDVERGVTEPVEEAVGVVGGLVQLTSVSRAGTSDVTLEFEWGTKIEAALQEIREKLDHLQLPREAKRPVLLRYDPNLDPIMRIGISGDRGLVALRSLADEDVRRSLESTAGVAAVKVRGGREEEIRVEVHRAALAQLGLDPRAVAERLGQENLNQPSGSLVEGDVQYLVRTLNEFGSQAEIGEIVIARKGDSVTRLKDIATIRRVSTDPKVLARIDGKEAVLLDIYREADANIVGVADAVRARLEGAPPPWWKKYARKEAKAEGTPAVEDDDRVKLPSGVRATILTDQSTFVRSAIDAVYSAAWQGALLSIIVLYLFLRSLTDTLIIGVAIPLSIITTFGAMHLSGISLNVMSLGGLALGVGMMVDASIVVLDSISRCRDEGDDRVAAAIRGTREVGLAVSASVLTTVVVFFPIAFIEGIAGQIFRDQALTVCISLMASMGVSLFFVPMLASREWKAPESDEKGPDWTSVSCVRRGFAWIPAPGIGSILATPVWVVLSILALPIDLFIEPWKGAWRRTLTYRERMATAWRTPRLASVVDGVLAILVFPIAFLFFHGHESELGLVFYLMFLAKRVFTVGAMLLGFAVSPLLWIFGSLMDRLNDFYPAALKVALRSKLLLAAASVAAAFGTVLLLPRLQQELIPTMHQGEFILEVSLPVGTPIERTDAEVAELEKAVLSTPGVARVVSAIGVEDDANRRENEGENTARIRVALKPAKDLEAAERDVLASLRSRFSSIPDLTVQVAHPVLFSFRPPLELEVRGHDLADIRRAARDAEIALAALPQLSDVQSTVGRGSPEIRVTYNRARLAEYGLDIASVAAIVQNQVLGTEATKLAEEERKVPVRVIGKLRDVDELERVAAIVVNPGAAIPVRLGAVATFARAEGPNEVRRVAHQRAALVRASVKGYDLAGATKAAEEAAARVPRGEDVSFVMGGQSREMKASAMSLIFATVLAVFLVYVVMAAQFESLLHPFLLMFTVPMGLVGTVIALVVSATPVSVVVAIGVIVLAGITVDNGIVLIDAANQVRATGASATDSILRAARTRLRPVLMTSLTTILGLVPMAFGIGDGAELQAPLAVAVLGGMLSATFLTLILVPILWHTVEARKDR